ncbi:MAG: type II toxin-antitoxin system death-on-curing family toxin [Actinobacteria bacterium]|nr:type II toxin-antitoxin system death-on-curing family toxin [Actinomycetota bacterium]
MPEVNYLTLPDVLAMHMVLIKRFGGSDGVRDMGSLESAVARPQSGYYKDVIESAAALFEGLAINHPFSDGNKRVAFAATDVFLRINGYHFTLQSKEIYAAMMKFFDTGTFKLATIEPWLRKSVSEN